MIAVNTAQDRCKVMLAQSDTNVENDKGFARQRATGPIQERSELYRL